MSSDYFPTTRQFFAAGVPSGQPRVKAYKRGPHAAVYTPDGLHNTWREQVAIAARLVELPSEYERGMAGKWKWPIPIRAMMTFYFPRPMGHFRQNKEGLMLHPEAPRYHTSRPDKDNLEKLVLDLLKRLCWYNDDSAVATGLVEKVYVLGGEKPGANITITWGIGRHDERDTGAERIARAKEEAAGFGHPAGEGTGPDLAQGHPRQIFGADPGPLVQNRGG